MVRGAQLRDHGRRTPRGPRLAVKQRQGTASPCQEIKKPLKQERYPSTRGHTSLVLYIPCLERCGFSNELLVSSSSNSSSGGGGEHFRLLLPARAGAGKAASYTLQMILGAAASPQHPGHGTATALISAAWSPSVTRHFSDSPAAKESCGDFIVFFFLLFTFPDCSCYAVISIPRRRQTQLDSVILRIQRDWSETWVYSRIEGAAWPGMRSGASARRDNICMQDTHFDKTLGNSTNCSSPLCSQESRSRLLNDVR